MGDVRHCRPGYRLRYFSTRTFTACLHRIPPFDRQTCQWAAWSRYRHAGHFCNAVRFCRFTWARRPADCWRSRIQRLDRQPGKSFLPGHYYRADHCLRRLCGFGHWQRHPVALQHQYDSGTDAGSVCLLGRANALDVEPVADLYRRLHKAAARDDGAHERKWRASDG
ncbi:hypothetical protein D3C84_813780 [compost metagenome]